MENTEGLITFQKMLAEQTKDILINAPMWMRLNYLSHSIMNTEESNIDWKKVRSILSENINQYDYNIIDCIDSASSFSHAVYHCQIGSLNMSAWQEHTCIDCHKKFEMSFGEVEFFKNKGFSIPKRCKSCRNSRKSSK